MIRSDATSTAKWNALDLVQAPAEEVLRELGYEYVSADALEAERANVAEPVLIGRLETALRHLNPGLDNDALALGVRAITQVTATGLVVVNDRIHTTLTHGASLDSATSKKRLLRTVRFIDFDIPENNKFLFSPHYRITSAGKTVVVDLVVFVNGIPLVVFACASPTSEEPIERAKQQLLHYQEAGDPSGESGALRLFHTAQILIATCGHTTTYGTVGWPAHDWRVWKAPYPLTLDELTARLGRVPTPQDVLLYGMLSRQNLLDLIRNFVLFEFDETHPRKLLPHYPQFIAVNRILEYIRNPQHTARSGVVCHTQGSGITRMKAFLAHKLHRTATPAITLLVVTDSRMLEQQNTLIFRKLGCTNLVQTRNSEHLRDVLARRGSLTVTTTTQKLQVAIADNSILSDGGNIVVVFDDTDTTRSLAAKLRRALPMAWFLAFTNAPNRVIHRIFPDLIHTYSFDQAVADRVTVPIYYESRLRLDCASGDDAGQSPAGESRRTETICRDLLEHFETFIRPNGFKALVVAANREAAVSYKETLDRLGAPPSAILISTQRRDPNYLTRWRSSKEDQRAYIARFCDRNDPLAILVSCASWPPGFHAPLAQVMYLDAPLRAHRLLQAIAHVNRIADAKDHGFLVDYWGIAPAIEEVVGHPSRSGGHAGLRPKADLPPILASRHRTAMAFFTALRRDDAEACLRVLEPEDTRAAFNLAFHRFARAMDMLLPDPEAQHFVPDLTWLGTLRNTARLRFRDERLDLSACRPKVRALIEGCLTAPSRPPVSLLDQMFEEEFRRLGSDAARASDLGHALRHALKQRLDANPVWYRDLYERLARVSEDRQASTIDDAEHLRRLTTLADELRSIPAAARTMDLDEAGLALYQLLRDEDERAGASGDSDRLRRDQAIRLLGELRALAIVDWVHKDDVQRRMRQAVKRSLRDSHPAHASIDDLTAKVINLARIWLAR